LAEKKTAFRKSHFVFGHLNRTITGHPQTAKRSLKINLVSVHKHA